MSIQPEGEDLRRAIEWISEQRKDNPEREVKELVNEASLKFDLPPNDQEFLYRCIIDDQCRKE